MTDHPSIKHMLRLLSGFGASFYPGAVVPGFFELSLGGVIYVRDSAELPGCLAWSGGSGSGTVRGPGAKADPEAWRKAASIHRQIADALELLNRCADDIHAYVDSDSDPDS